MGLDQSANTAELDDRKRYARQHQEPDQRHSNRRELLEHARQIVIPPARHCRQRRQRADPVGRRNAVQERRWAREPLRRRGRGMAAGRQRNPDARHGERGQHPRNRHARAFPREPRNRHRGDCNRQRRPEAGGECARPWRRCRDGAEGKVEQIEALQAERSKCTDETDGECAAAHRRSGRPLPDPGSRRMRRRRPRTARDKPRSAPARSAPSAAWHRPAARCRSRRRSKTPTIPLRDGRPRRPRDS